MKYVIVIVILMMLQSGCSMLPTGNSGSQAGNEQRLAVPEKSSVKADLKRALSAWQAGDIEQANSYFEKMLEKGPRSSATMNHYAIFLREQWEIDRAKAVYLQALNMAPRDPLTHYNVGILYELYLGDLKQALKHFKAYNKNVMEPNPKVKGWIADLTRRIEAEKNG